MYSVCCSDINPGDVPTRLITCTLYQTCLEIAGQPHGYSYIHVAGLITKHFVREHTVTLSDKSTKQRSSKQHANEEAILA